MRRFGVPARSPNYQFTCVDRKKKYHRHLWTETRETPTRPLPFLGGSWRHSGVKYRWMPGTGTLGGTGGQGEASGPDMQTHRHMDTDELWVWKQYCNVLTNPLEYSGTY